MWVSFLKHKNKLTRTNTRGKKFSPTDHPYMSLKRKAEARWAAPKATQDSCRFREPVLPGSGWCLLARHTGLLSETTHKLHRYFYSNLVIYLNYLQHRTRGGARRGMQKDCENRNKLNWQSSESNTSLSVIMCEQQTETTLISVSTMIHHEFVTFNSKLSSAVLCIRRC